MPARRNLRLDGLAVGALVGVLGAVAAGAFATSPPGPAVADEEGSPPSEARESEAPEHAALDPRVPASPESELRLRRTAVVDATERAAPSVVSIRTEATFVDFFRRPQVSSSDGSGVIIDEDGVVLTNYHVIEQAQRIVASTADGRSFRARFIGGAPELDLAVLRLDGAEGLPAIRIGTSSDLLLGEPVIAIGNPYGLGHTVTTGVVSAVSRPLETSERVYQDFIQTDASINPGNSGGPLLSVTGRLIGINTAIREGAEGIGFAIPADRALKVARDLVRFGSVQLPWLGVDLADQREGGAARGRLGVRVLRVHKGGGAAAAGVKPGDFVRSVEGHEVLSAADLNAWLSAREPGSTVTLRLSREGRELPVSVQTGRVPESVIEDTLSNVLGVELGRELDGIGIQIQAVSPTGELGRAGFRSGDVIVEINGRPVDTHDALLEAISAAKSAHRHRATLTLRRGDRGGAFFFSI
jgi:serine protease Do